MTTALNEPAKAGDKTVRLEEGVFEPGDEVRIDEGDSAERNAIVSIEPNVHARILTLEPLKMQERLLSEANTATLKAPLAASHPVGTAVMKVTRNAAPIEVDPEGGGMAGGIAGAAGGAVAVIGAAIAGVMWHRRRTEQKRQERMMKTHGQTKVSSCGVR